MDVRLVDQSRALGLGKDEIEEEDEADVGIERDPMRCVSLLVTRLIQMERCGSQ